MKIASGWCLAAVLAFAAAACSDLEGDPGDPGKDGLPGLQGSPGATGVAGATGTAGAAGGTSSPGLAATVAVSAYPGGQTYFKAGDTITITVTTTDKASTPNNVDITTTTFSRANVYIYGPLDQSRTKTAVGLMGVSGDANASVHDYVNLLASPAPAGVSINGNVATFVTSAITTEEAGTYRVTVWLVADQGKKYNYDRAFIAAEFQLGTATAETETVDGSRCARCHQGADNGQLYFHHTDGDPGNPDIDQGAIKTCKSCHNQDGYANTTDYWSAPLASTGKGAKVPDPIVRRVHGVHMGEELKSPRNSHKMAISNVTGNFAPASISGDPDTTPAVMIKGQTTGATAKVLGSDGSSWFALGHVTGSFQIGEVLDVTKKAYKWTAADLIGTAIVSTSTLWDSKGKTSTVAVLEGYFADYTTVVFPADVRNCTICHVDDRWKTNPNRVACGACHDNVSFDSANIPEGGVMHPGGPQPDDLACASCHTPSGPRAPAGNPNQQPIETVHDATPTAPVYTITAALDPAPGNGKYYVFGETPKVLVTVKDSAGNAVNPTTITETGWSALRLFVSGPRASATGPVLTTAATGKKPSGAALTSYPVNDIRDMTKATDDDPKVVARNTTTNAIEYQLDGIGVTGAGTYTVFVYGKKVSSESYALAKTSFQVGTATADKYIATNCTDCHNTTKMHGSLAPFDTDYCKNCHDYKKEKAGASDWAWDAYAPDPIVMKVHAVHRGAYLEDPLAIHSYPPDFSGVIFPQDIRNCTKCHSEGKNGTPVTTGTWNSEPSRMACGACHDSTTARSHMGLNTVDPTPYDAAAKTGGAWSGDEVEACKVCHGEGRDFEARKVHDVANPYRPPYKR